MTTISFAVGTFFKMNASRTLTDGRIEKQSVKCLITSNNGKAADYTVVEVLFVENLNEGHSTIKNGTVMLACSGYMQKVGAYEAI